MKKLKTISIIMCVVCLMFALAACGSDNPSEKSYWFKDYGTRFVAYDEAANSGKGNIEEAGTYWEMTMARDCTITISIRNNSNTMYSSTYFYVNGKQVKSDVSDFYTFEYKNLTLKKGDKLKFHAFWTNSLQTDSTGFEMSVLAISDGSGNYLIDLAK